MLESTSAEAQAEASRSAAAVLCDRSFVGHPRGLAVLFMTEMWERFSYYGMRALLILFMTAGPSVGGLGFPVPKAAAIYGIYTASVYLFGLPGGWIADHILGLRRTVLVGGALIALGNSSLILRGLPFFYLGLALTVLGTGMLKANISAIVGQLYSPYDARRDAGFSVFYMGINVGGFLAPLVCGYVAERAGWHWGFALAASGMVLGLVQFQWGSRYLGEAGAARVPAPKSKRATRQALKAVTAALGFGALVSLLSSWLHKPITPEELSTSMGLVLFLLSAGVFVWLFFRSGWTIAEQRRLGMILTLFLASALFWSIFEQAGSTLNLFADRNTRCELFGHAFPPSWFQALGSLFIILLAPLFGRLWIYLGPRDPSSPRKFTAGLLLAGLGFAVLIVPLAVDGDRVSPSWLVLTYLCHTAGELCVSPVGLSAMTKLAPERAAGFIMGIWFLSTAAGNYVGGRFASLYESIPLSHLFAWVAGCSVVGAVVLALLTPRIEELVPKIMPFSEKVTPC